MSKPPKNTMLYVRIELLVEGQPYYDAEVFKQMIKEHIGVKHRVTRIKVDPITRYEEV